MKALPSDLLSQPGAWTQGAFARVDPKSTEEVDPEGPDAKCWCVLGACHHCGVDYNGRLKLYQRLELDGCFDLVAWNDAPNRTQAEVVAMLKECGL